MIILVEPKDIAAIANSFTYDSAKFTDLERAIQRSLRSYAPPYGQALYEHLERSSFRLETYLREQSFGLSDKAITNIVHAFRFHDGGKTLQSADIWNLDEAPSKGDPRRVERRKHGDLIVPWLEDHLKSFPKIPKDHPYLSLIACFGVYHHERIDGRGPKELKGDDLGKILEILGIVDTLDGKLMPRTNRPSRSEAEVLREMTGDPRYTKKPNHEGEFDWDLLSDYIRHRQGYCAEFILQELKASAPLAPPGIS